MLPETVACPTCGEACGFCSVATDLPRVAIPDAWEHHCENGHVWSFANPGVSQPEQLADSGNSEGDHV
jgi:hypothetical protein